MASTLRPCSVMIDYDRIKYIQAHTTPGAREFSKWVRDAIDLRVELERKAEVKRRAEQAAAREIKMAERANQNAAAKTTQD